MTKAGKKIIAGLEEAVQVAKGEKLALITLKPSRSEPLRFWGKIIAETEWDTPSGEWMRFEIWETRGGAYIATREGSIPNSDRTILEACVVEPIRNPDAMTVYDEPIDRAEMQREVMRFFEFHDRARSMVKPLKWHLRREIA